MVRHHVSELAARDWWKSNRPASEVLICSSHSIFHRCFQAAYPLIVVQLSVSLNCRPRRVAARATFALAARPTRDVDTDEMKEGFVGPLMGENGRRVGCN